MRIKFYGKSQEVDVPQALSQVFVNRSDNIPSAGWSWRNRFLAAIHGASDARGFNQWKEAGRRVSKGAKAFHILGPCIAKREVKNEATGETETKPFLYGFKSIPVFSLENTEITDKEQWEKCGGVDNEEEQRLQELPLRQVAAVWGLNVTSYNGQNQGTLGYYQRGNSIALGVENLSTWTHEMVHAADDKNGTLATGRQNPGNEIVAEFGGAVLLKLMGYDNEADFGGAWDYIKAYAQDDKDRAIKKCFKLIDRVCNAVNLIIETAEQNENLLAA